jgi:hypothetical protein
VKFLWPSLRRILWISIEISALAIILPLYILLLHKEFEITVFFIEFIMHI